MGRTAGPKNNLYENIPSSLPEELTEVLVGTKHARVERIVSTGHASPDGFWYDQHEHEWFVVLRGEALIRIEGTDEPIRLRAGDHIHLEPHCRHRVEWTSPHEPTIWLAVFC